MGCKSWKKLSQKLNKNVLDVMKKFEKLKINKKYIEGLPVLALVLSAQKHNKRIT